MENNELIKYMNADEAIEMCLSAYGEHSLRSKLPNIIDGLKAVQRRILLTHHTSDTPKVVSVTGRVLDQYHPYGDGAIAEAIVRMAQPFNTYVTLMSSESNIGDYGGGEAAKPRYLPIAASKLAQFVYFNNIDIDVLEQIPRELDKGTEPRFLVPRIPMALLVASFGMGLGYRSDPANLCLGDVCTAVTEYITLLQTRDKKSDKQFILDKLSKYFIPESPIELLLRNKDDLLSSFKQNNFKRAIVVDGTMTMYNDKIIVHTFPIGVKPRVVWEKIGMDLKNNKDSFATNNITTCRDFSKGVDTCCLEIQLKRGINPMSILDDLKQYIGFTRSWTPSYTFINRKGKVAVATPLDIIDIWLYERTRCIKAELTSGQHKLVKRIRLVEALIKIGSDFRTVVGIITEADTTDSAVPVLCDKYDLTKTQAYALFEAFRLTNIPKQGRDVLIQEKRELLDNLNDIQTRFLNTNETIVDDCERAMTKFPSYIKRNNNAPKFTGCVNVEGGMIQFASYDEMFELADRLTVVGITIYPQDIKSKLLLSGYVAQKEGSLEFPKEMVGDTLLASDAVFNKTVVQTPKGACRFEGVVYRDLANHKYTYLSEGQGRVVMKSGEVRIFSMGDFVVRISPKSYGVKHEVKFVSNCKTDKIVVAFTDTTNTIKLQIVSVGMSMVFEPESIKHTEILGACDFGESLTVTLPKEFINKNNTTHLVIRDTSILTEGVLAIKMNGKITHIPNVVRQHGIVFG